MKRLISLIICAVLFAYLSVCFAQSEVEVQTNLAGIEFSQSKWDDMENKATEQKGRELEKVTDEESSTLPPLKMQLENLKLKIDELSITISNTQDNINNSNQKKDLLGSLPEIEDELEANRKRLKELEGQRTIAESQQHVLQMQVSQAESRYSQLKSDINEKYNQAIELLKIQSDNAKTKSEKLKVVKHYQDLANKGEESAMLRLSDFYREGFGVEVDLEKSAEYTRRWDRAIQAKAKNQTEEEKIREQTELHQKFLHNLDLADHNDNVFSALYVEKCYRYGIGVKKDPDLADKYHKRAISLGLPQKPNTHN